MELAWRSVLGLLLFVKCDAQFGVEDRELVAQFKTNFSKGRIWKDDNDYSLELNGITMSDTSDEHVYHELLVHPALLSITSPHYVLIIGGAEGATAREVLRHIGVKNVTMVDIDQDLVNMCRNHLHAMHQGSFDSPKLQVQFDEGSSFVGCMPGSVFDAVIIDGIDVDVDSKDWSSPVTYGNSLFSEDFYRHVHHILRPGGVMVQYVSDADPAKYILSVGFASLIKYGVNIWSYPGYGARFMLAGKDVQEPLEDRIMREVAKSRLELRYLTIDTMDAAFRHNARRMKSGGNGGDSGAISTAIFIGCWLCVCCCFVALCYKYGGTSIQGDNSDSEASQESNEERVPLTGGREAVVDRTERSE